jgi:DNA-directed RNA polymerase specialized sigma24 family protein
VGVFTANRDRIYRYVLGIVHNRAEAEDFTQETFLRSDRGPGVAAARDWL